MDCLFYDTCNHKDCNKDFCVKNYKLSSLYKAARFEAAQCKPVVLWCKDKPGPDSDFAAFGRLRNIETNIIDFISNGYNLYLHSNQCGCGKSSWAVRLVQAYFNKIWPGSDLTCKALYINVPRFLEAIKSSFSVSSEYVDYVKANIYKADVVIWDEVGAKVGTEFELTQLIGFIDTRISMGKSNIYTTNQNKAALTQTLGERLTSRICEASVDIEFVEGGKRTDNVGGKY